MLARHPHHLLVVPGLGDSGAGHWQSLWQARAPRATRVVQRDWHRADLAGWSRRIAIRAPRANVPVVAVAHSFGCLALAHVARAPGLHLAAALLVAPADPAKFGIDAAAFPARFSIPALVVGSATDPWMKEPDARRWAERWGCGFVGVGDAGHINVDSGHGKWPEGEQLLAQLLASVRAPVTGAAAPRTVQWPVPTTTS